MAYTAQEATRSGSLKNAEFTNWAAGLPVGYGFVETAQADLVQLTDTMMYKDRAGRKQYEMDQLRALGSAPWEPLTKHRNAVRIRSTAAWAAGDVQFGVDGQILSAVDTWGVPWAPGSRMTLGAWLRGTEGKLLNVRIMVFDDSGAGTEVGFLQEEPTTWAATATGASVQNTSGLYGLLVKLTPRFTLHTFRFVVPDAVGGNIPGSPDTHSLQFFVQNASTSTVAGDFVWDVGGFQHSIQDLNGLESDEA